MILPGTTTVRAKVRPSRCRATFSSARAAGTTVSSAAPGSTLTVPRSLPLTCTAIFNSCAAALAWAASLASVAALTPKAEIEGEMGDSHVGLQARLMSQALRKLTSNLNKSKTICIFINQLREKIGVMFGSPETTPGGLCRSREIDGYVFDYTGHLLHLRPLCARHDFQMDITTILISAPE